METGGSRLPLTERMIIGYSGLTMIYDSGHNGNINFLQSIFYPAILVFFLLLVGCTDPLVPKREPQFFQAKVWEVYQGAWFDISYPSQFIPTPSLQSRTAKGYDSVEFLSPNGDVSFYIFAPQWGGIPTDIVLAPQGEVVVKESEEKKNGTTIKTTVICKIDDSFCRSIWDTISHQGTVRTTLGFKYRNEEVRRRYKESYQKFQYSLQRYAD